MNGAATKQAYERYIELLNAQDFGALDEVVDPERYREICVGFTPGWVNPPGRLPRNGESGPQKSEEPSTQEGS